MLALGNHAALAEMYLDRLAFDWQRRVRQEHSHVRDFAQLRGADRVIAACAQALPRLGPATTPVIRQRLAEALLPGEMFALSLCAIDGGAPTLRSTCMDLAQAMPRLRWAFASALQWAGPAAVLATVQHWPQHDDLGDAFAWVACTAHPELLPAVRSGRDLDRADNPMVLHARLACGLHTGDTRVGAQAAALLHAPALRGLAAEVLLLAGQPRTHGVSRPRAIETLQQVALQLSPDTAAAERAARALACQAPQALDEVLAAWAAQAQPQPQQRLYLQSLAWRGDLAALPVLVDALDHPQHARIAGAALSLLTGSLPARDGWQAPPVDAPAPAARLHDTDAVIPASDPDAELPPPDRAGFLAWWRSSAPQPGAPLPVQAGQPATAQQLLQILRHGRLAWRELAATRLQALQGGPRFATHLPAARQQLRLHQLDQELARP